LTLTVKIRNRVKELLVYDREELITLNLFWIGFLLYSIAATFIASKQINYLVFQSIQLLGALILIPAAARIIKFKFENQYQKIIFVLIIFWSIVIFLRGFYLDKDSLKQIILSAWFGGFLYFVPLFMLFPKKLILYKKVFSVILISGIFYVIISMLFISDLMEAEKNVLSRDMVEYFSKSIAVPVIFILLTYVYHSKKRNLLAFGILLLCIFFALVRARRGLLFMTVGSFFFIFILFWINTKYKIIVFLLLGGFIIVMVSVAIYFLTNSDVELLGFLQQRGVEDTRSGVEKYFYRDMEGLDWIVGRGMFGVYYCPTMAEGNFRGTVETDYLNMILKGGLIQVGLFLLMFIPAIYKGLFRSKNTLSKAAAIWILFWMINTHPSTVQVFTLNYILVWISVGICYSDTIRNLSEKGLITYFKS